MSDYKCPICGNKEKVKINLLEIDQDYKADRTLLCINTTEAGVFGVANCETYACTNCGFVSMHALNLAQYVKKNPEEKNKSFKSVLD